MQHCTWACKEIARCPSARPFKTAPISVRNGIHSKVPLFAVSGGVPVDVALDHATDLLDSASHIANSNNVTGDTAASTLWAIMHLVEGAKSALHAITEGMALEH